MTRIPEEQEPRPTSSISRPQDATSGIGAYSRQRSTVPDRSPAANLLNIQAEESLREFFSDSSASSGDDGSSVRVSGWPSNSNTTPLSSEGSPNANLRVQLRMKNAAKTKKRSMAAGKNKHSQMRRPSFMPFTEKMIVNQLN